MLKNIFYGILIGCICISALWFFAGRFNSKPILATAEAISENHRRIESVGNTLTERFNRMEFSASRIGESSKTITSGADNLIGTGEDLKGEFGKFESGLRELAGGVETGERRLGRIVGLVSRLRDVNEDFWRANQKYEIQD